MTILEKCLYIVATPIGNLNDITFRAVEILKLVDIILCEDTRNSSHLLSHFQINNKKLMSYHKFNEKSRVENIKRLILEENKKIALVSDAGTPCISDPGRVLVNSLSQEGIKIVPVPGACAFVTFLSAIYKQDEAFAFLGFLPRTFEAQKKLLLKNSFNDIVFYESASRLIKTLNNIERIFGEDTFVSIGRELTKIYEEIKTDSIKNIIDFYQNNILKGEIVVVIYKNNSNNFALDLKLLSKIEQLKNKGFSKKDIVTILVTLYEFNKNEIYNKI